MTEYWMISVPGNPQPANSWNEIEDKTASISSNSKFTIPDLKVQRCSCVHVCMCAGFAFYCCAENNSLYIYTFLALVLSV